MCTFVDVSSTALKETIVRVSDFFVSGDMFEKQETRAMFHSILK